MKQNKKDREYLDSAADAVTEQAMNNPGIGIPVDPDVAEHMGIFNEDALTELDAIEGAIGLVDSTMPDDEAAKE